MTKGLAGPRTEGVWKGHNHLVVANGDNLRNRAIHRSTALREQPVSTPTIRFNFALNTIALIDYGHRRWLGRQRRPRGTGCSSNKEYNYQA